MASTTLAYGNREIVQACLEKPPNGISLSRARQLPRSLWLRTHPRSLATNLIGNTSIPSSNVEVRVLSTGAATSANFGRVRTASFDSLTGQITLNSPLPVAPSEGDIISIGGQAGVTLSDHAFRPIPFGNDISAEFGDELRSH